MDDNTATGVGTRSPYSSSSSIDLTSLSPTELIARINDLEARLKSSSAKLAELTKQNACTTGEAKVGVSEDPSSSPKTEEPLKNFVKVKKAPKPFDFSRYSTRLIALKFAYLGHRYNGLEHTNGDKAPLRPTVEEVLWKALRKARLIPPEVPAGCDGSFDVVYGEQDRKKLYWREKTKLELDWTGLGYSKCGRTDKGVSAFGQVVTIRVRSSRPKNMAAADETEILNNQPAIDTSAGSASELHAQPNFDPIKDELPYISILNSVLPPDIKVLAWCSDPGPDFSARFSCRERRYKYFFTNPAFCPTPGPLGLKHANGQRAPGREGFLDISAMRDAAKRLEGLHDFRNFCKIDASKQMGSCERRVTFADIEEMPAGIDLSQFMVDSRINQTGEPIDWTNGAIGSMTAKGIAPLKPTAPKVYAFAVHGTAFLWHQVRCMVAILFLVGQRLEEPGIIDELLDIARTPAKPHYEMADDAPLVLWDCVFPGDEPQDDSGIKWIHAGDEISVPALAKKGDSQYDGKFGIGGLVSDIWAEWREAKMRETLTAGLLSLALNQGDGTSLQRSGFRIGTDPKHRSQRIFDGGNLSRNVGDYVPLMQKSRMDTLEMQNAKYLLGKQARRDLKNAGSSDKE